MNSGSNAEPADDLDDEVTVAANSDVVDEIRRNAAERKAAVAAESPAEGFVDDVDDEDDITVPAPPMRSPVRRTAVPAVQEPPVRPESPAVQESPAVEEPPAVQEPIRPEPAASEQRASRKVVPKTTPVSTPIISPFEDDGASLIAERPEPARRSAWEPPTRFAEDQVPVATKSGPSFWKLAMLLATAIILTAVVTAVVVIALTDGL